MGCKDNKIDDSFNKSKDNCSSEYVGNANIEPAAAVPAVQRKTIIDGNNEIFI